MRRVCTEPALPDERMKRSSARFDTLEAVPPAGPARRCSCWDGWRSESAPAAAFRPASHWESDAVGVASALAVEHRNSTLLGLRSPWMTFFDWMYSMPRAMSLRHATQFSCTPHRPGISTHIVLVNSAGKLKQNRIPEGQSAESPIAANIVWHNIQGMYAGHTCSGLNIVQITMFPSPLCTLRAIAGSTAG